MIQDLQTAPPEPELSVAKQKIAVVVDDNPTILALNSSMLRKLGYEVKTFEDGELALDYFNAGGAADLLLTDNNMEWMDGINLLRKLTLRELMPENVIMNTGRPSPELEGEVKELGAKFLLKGFNTAALKAVIEENAAAPTR
jgi:CheY-like chemotaxis protein